MKIKCFVKQSLISSSVQRAFEWHRQPQAFERLQPPWSSLKIIDRQGEDIQDGTVVTLEMLAGWVKGHLKFRHFGYQANRQFCDRQIEGPFAFWEHLHRFQEEGSSEFQMKDEVFYALPFGWIGDLLGYRYVEKELERLFRYRHTILKHDLSMHQGVKPMKILVTGSSGLVGQALIPFLTTGGHQVLKLVRRKTSLADDERSWDPERGLLDSQIFEDVDAVIHLAGENIGTSRWTDEKKRRIMDSRILGTRLLSRAIAELKTPPKVLISASAIGFYGNQADRLLDESAAKGEGFLADVCQKWEEATHQAEEKGVRVVHTRIGVVLSPKGGALQLMLTPFKLGVGGRIGSGQQYMSWIAIDDLLAIFSFLLQREDLRGVFNAVSPQPITNETFTKILGTVLHRPSFLPMPAFVARLVFGEAADELLLSSTRAIPKRLQEAGFQFGFGNLEQALQHLLGCT